MADQSGTAASVAGKFAPALAAYGAELLERLIAEAPVGDGHWISPVGLATALATAAAGDDGASRQELLKHLHLEEFLAPDACSLQELLSRLRPLARLDTDAAMASALWVKCGVAEAFVHAVREEVGSQVGQLESADQVNAWAAKETAGNIRAVVDDATVKNPLLRLLITTAVHFKGKWQTAFARQQTCRAPFRVDASQTLRVPMMALTATLPVFSSPDFVACKLPYRSKQASRALEAVVVVPRGEPGTPDIALLKEALAARFIRRRARVSLPRFTADTSASLAKTMQGMGVTTPFSDGPFTGMSAGEELYIGGVLHKCHIRVDEEGTEASATTVVKVLTRSRVRQPELTEVRADRPFFFAICHQQSGLPFFVGLVRRPSEGHE